MYTLILVEGTMSSIKVEADDIRELWWPLSLFYKCVLQFTTFKNVSNQAACEHFRYTVPRCIIAPLLQQLNGLLRTRGTSVITPAMVDEVAREYYAPPIPPRTGESPKEEMSLAFNVTMTEDAAKVVDWILRSWLASVFETVAKRAVTEPSQMHTVTEAINQNLPPEYVEYVQKYALCNTKTDGYLRVLFNHALQYAPSVVSVAFSTEDHSPQKLRGVLGILGDELLPRQSTVIEAHDVGRYIRDSTSLTVLVKPLGIHVPTLPMRPMASEEASRTLCVDPDDEEYLKLVTLADAEEQLGAPNWFYTPEQQEKRIERIRAWLVKLRESQQQMLNGKGKRKSDGLNEPPSKRAKSEPSPDAQPSDADAGTTTVTPSLGSTSHLLWNPEGFELLVACLGVDLRYGGIAFEAEALERFQEVCERRSRMILHKADQLMRQMHIGQDWSKVVLNGTIMRLALNEMRW